MATGTQEGTIETKKVNNVQNGFDEMNTRNNLTRGPVHEKGFEEKSERSNLVTDLFCKVDSHQTGAEESHDAASDSDSDMGTNNDNVLTEEEKKEAISRWLAYPIDHEEVKRIMDGFI